MKLIGLFVCLIVAPSEGIVTRGLMLNPYSFPDNNSLQKYGISRWTLVVSNIIAGKHCEEFDGSIIKELGEMKNVCPDIEFDFWSADSQRAAEPSVQTYLEHEQDIDFIVGASRSAVTIPLAIAGAAMDAYTFSYYSTSPQLSNKEVFSRFARSIPSDQGTSVALARILKQYELSHVGLLYVDDNYGSAYRDVLLEQLTDLGITIHSHGHQRGSNTSVITAMEVLKRKQVNVIVVVSFEVGNKYAVDFAVKNGMTGEGKLLIFAEAKVGELSEIASISPAHAKALNRQQVIGGLGGKLSNPVFQKFKNVWKQMENNPEVYQYIKDRFPGNSSKYKWSSGRNIESYSITPNFFIDSEEYLSLVAPYAYDVVAMSCLALCEASSKYGSTKGEYVRKVLLDPKFGFLGVSGQIFLEYGSGDRDLGTAPFGLFSISVHNNGIHLESIGEWENSTWNLKDTIYFPPGQRLEYPTTADPPEQELNDIGIEYKIFGYVLFGLLEIMCFGFLIWIFFHKNAEVVKKSQPIFLMFCLGGVIVSNVSIFLITIDDQDPNTSRGADFACNGWWVFLSLGNTILFGALISKLYRVMKIFNNPALKVVKITNLMLYRRMGILILIDVILIGVWLGVAPLEYRRVILEKDDFGQPWKSFGECDGEHANVFTTLLILFHFFLLLTAVYIGYNVRNVDSHYQETNHLYVAILSMTQIYLLGLPTYLAIDETIKYVRFLVLASIIAINNCVFVLLLMVPKVLHHNRKKKENSSESSTNSSNKSSKLHKIDESFPSKLDPSLSYQALKRPPSVSSLDSEEDDDDDLRTMQVL